MFEQAIISTDHCLKWLADWIEIDLFYQSAKMNFDVFYIKIRLKMMKLCYSSVKVSSH